MLVVRNMLQRCARPRSSKQARHGARRCLCGGRQQELRGVTAALHQEVRKAQDSARRLQQQYDAQQAHWKAVVQVLTAPPSLLPTPPESVPAPHIAFLTRLLAAGPSVFLVQDLTSQRRCRLATHLSRWTVRPCVSNSLPVLLLSSVFLQLCKHSGFALPSRICRRSTTYSTSSGSGIWPSYRCSGSASSRHPSAESCVSATSHAHRRLAVACCSYLLVSLL